LIIHSVIVSNSDDRLRWQITDISCIIALGTAINIQQAASRHAASFS